MSKPRPTWQDVPTNLKLCIIELLDFKSRNQLRNTSKFDRLIVDKIPILLKLMKIDVTSDELIFESENQKIEKLNFDHRNFEIHIPLLSRIFENPKSKIETFFIYGFSSSGKVDALISMFPKNQNWKKIKAEKLKFWVDRIPENSGFLEFFNLFDPKFLRSFSACADFSEDLLRSLTSSEYWKNLKKVSLGILKYYEISWFLKMEKIRFSAPSISAEDIWKVVEEFLKKPAGSYFDFGTTKEKFDIEKILEFFEKSGKVVVKNEPVKKSDSSNFIHSQRFKTKTLSTSGEADTLVVKIACYTIYGFIFKSSRKFDL